MVLHHSNIEIPARFAFRPFRARWMVSRAEIVDWVDETSGNPNPFDPPGETRPYRPTEKVAVSVDVSLPASWILGGEISSEIVEVERSDLSEKVFGPQETRRTAPIVSGRKFDLLVCPMQAFAETIPSLTPGNVEKNAWLMRDEFFALEDDDVDALCLFLNRWGFWDKGRGYRISHFGGKPAPLPFAVAFPHHIWKLRDEFSHALATMSPRAWLARAGALTFSQVEKPPYFLLERQYCSDAIHASITIDKLLGTKFSFCKRCRRLFEHENLHRKQYCSRRCIQADAVKRWRASKKAEILKKSKVAKAGRRS